MRIIQTNYNSNDFQSRVITIKEEYTWKSFCNKIINCPVNMYISDYEMIVNTEPYMIGNILPKHFDIFALQNDSKHLMVEYELYNGQINQSLFYLLEE